MATDRNTLYYGDNLAILREHVASETIDLVYLDPPFNSNRSYNVLFKDESGKESQAQIAAFDDTWHWGEETERAYNELVTDINGQVGNIIGALRQAIGANQIGSGRRTGLMSRSEFQRAEAAFERLRTPAGLPLTYDVIYLHACK